MHLGKKLGNLFAKNITRAHLPSALDAMARKGIKEDTRKTLTILNLMLDYGLTRHSIGSNPARMLKLKDFAVSVNRSRARVSMVKYRGKKTVELPLHEVLKQLEKYRRVVFMFSLKPLRHLAMLRGGLTPALRQLGVNVKSLETWCVCETGFLHV